MSELLDQPKSKTNAFFQGVESSALTPAHKIGLIIDPDVQPSSVAIERASHFLSIGGKLIFVGGSGQIDLIRYQNTVRGLQDLAESNEQLSVIVFPGHVTQIPESPRGIAGVITYSKIVGALPESPVYGKETLQRFHETVVARGFRAIPTVYILCGSANSSVCRFLQLPPISPIPENLSVIGETIAAYHPELVYLEGGSGAGGHIPVAFAQEIRPM